MADSDEQFRKQAEFRNHISNALAANEQARAKVEQQIQVLGQAMEELGQQQRRALDLDREDLAGEASRRMVDVQAKLTCLQAQAESLSAERSQLIEAGHKAGMIYP
jgi:phage shock protein A